MISALLMDFGGTLDGPSHWLDRFLAQYRAAGIEITRVELDAAFDHATKTGYRAENVVQRFGLADLVRFLVGQQVEFLIQRGPEAIRANLGALDARGRHRIVEEIAGGFVATTRKNLAANRELVVALRKRFRLGVVSNFYGNLDRIIDECGMKPLIDAIIDSSRIGIFKPDPAIFEAALKALGVDAASTAMVGDSLDKDCVPAHRLGMKTVWYRPGSSAEDPASNVHAEVRPDFTIRALGELAELGW